MKKSLLPFLAAVTAVASMLSAYFAMADLVPFRAKTVQTNVWVTAATNGPVDGFVEAVEINLLSGGTTDVRLVTVTNSETRQMFTLFSKDAITASGRYQLRFPNASAGGVATNISDKLYLENTKLILQLTNAAPTNIEVTAVLFVSKED